MPSGKDVSQEQMCHTYPRFMEHLDHKDAHAAFWCLWVLVILLLCATSNSFGKEHNCRATHWPKKCPKKGCAMRQKFTSKGDHNLSESEKKRAIFARRLSCNSRCLFASLLCASIGAVATTFASLAGLNLQFCHGETMMVFIWSLWSLLGLGAELAMWGVVFHQLRMRYWPNEPLPPWNVALGTPVLVVAGIGHWLWSLLWSLCTGRVAEKEKEDGDGDDEDEDDEDSIELPDRGVQLMYTKKPSGDLPLGATLRHNKDGSWKVFIPHGPCLEQWLSKQGQQKETGVQKEDKEQDGVAFSTAVTVNNVEDEGEISLVPAAVIR